MKINKKLFLILCLVAAIFLPSAKADENNGGALGRIQMNEENQDLGEQVRLAFEALRKGDYQLVAALKNTGAAIVPLLKPYQTDVDPRVRTQVVWFLKHNVGKDSVPLLAKAINDTDKNISADAARTLYEFYESSLFDTDAETGSALRKAVAAGNDSTAALLLLGYFPAPETEHALEAVAKRAKNTLTGSFMQFPMVAPALPARVSLSRIGSANANRALIETIKTGKQNDLEFLLRAIESVDDAKVLTELFQKTIVDNREIQTTIDGDYKGKNLLARMKDLAVNVFVEKLKLDFNFAIQKNKRYKKAEITEARQKILASLAEKISSE